MTNINTADSFAPLQQSGRNILEKTHDNAVIGSLTYKQFKLTSENRLRLCNTRFKHE